MHGWMDGRMDGGSITMMMMVEVDGWTVGRLIIRTKRKRWEGECNRPDFAYNTVCQGTLRYVMLCLEYCCVLLYFVVFGCVWLCFVFCCIWYRRYEIRGCSARLFGRVCVVVCVYLHVLHVACSTSCTSHTTSTALYDTHYCPHVPPPPTIYVSHNPQPTATST